MEKEFSRAEIEPMIAQASFEGKTKTLGFCVEYIQVLLEPDLNQLKYLQESGMTLGEDFMHLYVRTSTLLGVKKAFEKLLNELKTNNT
jgi:hypothetical protein